MQAGKLTNSRQLRKLSGRKSIGGRQSMSGGVRSSAMARGSFVAHIRKTRSEESEKNLDMSGIQEEESETDLVPGDEMKSLVVAEEMRSKTPVEEAPFEQATKPVTKSYTSEPKQKSLTAIEKVNPAKPDGSDTSQESGKDLNLTPIERIRRSKMKRAKMSQTSQ